MGLFLRLLPGGGRRDESETNYTRAPNRADALPEISSQHLLYARAKMALRFCHFFPTVIPLNFE